jgi:predicted dehydrogenase
MKIAIWGLGSIGRRHWQNFKSQDFSVCGISGHAKEEGVFPNLKECLSKEQPEIVFICKETSSHIKCLEELSEAGFNGGVLLEKPLFSNYNRVDNKKFAYVMVSYQLRFNPLIEKLRQELKDQKILTALFYVGQHLPDWRKNRDYRLSYSSKKEEGGGALRDLSHEIDLAIYLTGSFKKLTALGGKISTLEINSDDSFSILAETSNCPQLQIHMNYLCRSTERFILINTESHTYKVDLVNKQFTKDGKVEIFEYEGNETYLKMCELIKNRNYQDFCHFEEGLECLKIIEVAEMASNLNKWVQL